MCVLERGVFYLECLLRKYIGPRYLVRTTLKRVKMEELLLRIIERRTDAPLVSFDLERTSL